jgi:hypothetical protein
MNIALSFGKYLIQGLYFKGLISLSLVLFFYTYIFLIYLFGDSILRIKDHYKWYQNSMANIQPVAQH